MGRENKEGGGEEGEGGGVRSYVTKCVERGGVREGGGTNGGNGGVVSGKGGTEREEGGS